MLPMLPVPHICTVVRYAVRTSTCVCMCVAKCGFVSQVRYFCNLIHSRAIALFSICTLFTRSLWICTERDKTMLLVLGINGSTWHRNPSHNCCASLLNTFVIILVAVSECKHEIESHVWHHIHGGRTDFHHSGAR